MVRTTWVRLMQGLLGPIQKQSQAAITRLNLGDHDLSAACACANAHLFGCLKLGNDAKDSHSYAIALCLLRQCVESLNVLELGLVGRPSAIQVLAAWRGGTRSCGEIRKFLGL